MPKYYKEVILKDNTFWLLSKNELKNSRSLMSTVNYGTKVLCMVWVLWRYAHECSLKLMSAVGTVSSCSWVLMVLKHTYECGNNSKQINGIWHQGN